MKVKNTYYNIFHFNYSWFRWPQLKWNLKRLVRIPKYIYQRAKYGICDLDITDFCTAMCNVMYQGLSNFAENTMSWPDYLFETPEEWEKYLKDLANDWQRLYDVNEFFDKELFENGKSYEEVRDEWEIFKSEVFNKTEFIFGDLWS